MNLDIRSMRRADLDIALGWARDEGWSPGLGDAGPFYAQDPSGFLMGWLGAEPIGCISVVKYGADFAFLGLYIVRPAWRGKGYGKAIWDAGIASAAGRSIGLDGVPAQQANYAAMGFAPAYDTIRMTGRPRDLGAVASLVESVAQIATMDAAGFPASRQTFLAEWIKPPRRALMLDGAYGAVRPCVTGLKIGPLFAPDTSTALRLLGALTHETVWIDVPTVQAGFIDALTETGFTASFSTTRMYLGRNLDPAAPQVFGVTTLELG